jgi:O-methyltransferase
MSKLDDANRRHTLKSWALDECYQSKSASVILDDKQALHQWAVDYIGAESSLTYLEFGVAHGDSLRFFSSSFKHPNAAFFGFDSFEGLPEAWLHMPKFFFGRNGIPPGFDDARIRLNKGWFQNIIPPFMAQWQKPDGKVLIHYDADLYGSTLFALTMVWTKIPDYYFIMDDFYYDDAVALFDFASAYPVDIQFLAQGGRDGNGKAVPLKIFGRIQNRQFDPS